MGGNALKNTYTRRYRKGEYLRLVDDVIAIIKTVLPNCLVDPLKTYDNKESFGDMDVLVELVGGGVDYTTIIKHAFSPNEVVKNGNVISFDYHELQIDIILTRPEIFKISQTYFYYSDCGNLQGRIAKKQGFKYGHDGLHYVVNDGDYQFTQILLSRDSRTIFSFLGYDYDRWLQGFDTLTDIFEFVVSTEFFNKDIFLLHNRNHKARTRDAKRKTYSDFLVWCETADSLPEYEWKNYRTKNREGGQKFNGFVDEAESKLFLQRAFDYFPDFKQNYAEAMIKFDETRKFKAKFNGALVMELTGLTGKELGAFMGGLKARACFVYRILEMTEEEIKDFILTEFSRV